MSSFKDQFLKAGVIDAKKAKKATREQHKAQKLQKNSKAVAVDKTKEAAAKALAEKVARDRKLNEARKAAAQAKAIKAQIRQLIENNRRPEPGEDAVGYNFADGKSVKKLYVSPESRDQLAKGVLAIVRLENAYEIVPAQVADKIKQRDDSAIVYQQDKNTTDADDAYADYEIPDDLMW